MRAHFTSPNAGRRWLLQLSNTMRGGLLQLPLGGAPTASCLVPNRRRQHCSRQAFFAYRSCRRTSPTTIDAQRPRSFRPRQIPRRRTTRRTRASPTSRATWTATVVKNACKRICTHKCNSDGSNRGAGTSRWQNAHRNGEGSLTRATPPEWAAGARETDPKERRRLCYGCAMFGGP